MSFLAPFMIVFSIVVAVKLVGAGIRLSRIAIGCAVLGFAGLIMVISGINSAPDLAEVRDPGPYGRVGILFILSALFAGITLAIIGIISEMSKNIES